MKTVSNFSKRLSKINWSVMMILALVLSLSACSDKKESTKTEATESAESASMDLSPLAPDPTLDWAKADAAGMSWEIPVTWTVGPDMPMRAGTYFASAAAGDSEPAECRVNFFGAGQGGEVDGNILRWTTQMEVEGEEGNNPTPIVRRLDIGGVPVAVIELSGVYLSKTRPMAKEFTRKTGFKMFAAIATAAEGTVFFKMTGPLKTMEANRESFRQMIGSITSGS